MMAKTGTTREKTTLILLLFVVLLVASHEESGGMGVDAACNNLPMSCWLKCGRPGGCNRCCKKHGFVRGECVGIDCYCCRE
ncbi:unnamed protein product [Urochloa decumbens]|uniref:Uncharacterized protein n=1 Tax=Urochloa decumbens TaxID=240449 RepID=A0ABC9HAV8_9POAL